MDAPFIEYPIPSAIPAATLLTIVGSGAAQRTFAPVFRDCAAPTQKGLVTTPAKTALFRAPSGLQTSVARSGLNASFRVTRSSLLFAPRLSRIPANSARLVERCVRRVSRFSLPLRPDRAALSSRLRAFRVLRSRFRTARRPRQSSRACFRLSRREAAIRSRRPQPRPRLHCCSSLRANSPPWRLVGRPRPMNSNLRPGLPPGRAR